MEALSQRSPRRLLALFAALLLALPLVASQANPAQALEPPTYETNWPYLGDDLGPDIGTVTGATRTLERHLDARDYSISDVEETFDVEPAGAATLDDCQSEAFSGDDGNDGGISSTCEVEFHLDEASDGLITITSTLTADGPAEIEIEQTVTVAVLDAAMVVVSSTSDAVPIPGQINLDLILMNTGAGPLDVTHIHLQDTGGTQQIDGDCDHLPQALAAGGGTEVVNCSFDVDEDTEPTVTVWFRANASLPTPGVDSFSRSEGDVFDLVGLSVEALYGAHNETLDDLFVERRLLPINPLPAVASGPAVLEVTVTNDGTIDLDDVEVVTDLDGCSATLDLAAGGSEVFECAGEPVGPGDVQPTTTVTATADVDGGPSLTATDVASFDVIGIELDVTVDPDWDGTGVELPFLLTLTNIGGLDLEGNTYETFLGELHGERFDDCTKLGLTTLPVGGTANHDDCTLLAGDLVDGLSIVAYGSDGPAIGEWLTSHDVVEVQLDPNGTVEGIAELNGEAFGNVEVDLHLLELLELPSTESTAPDPVPMGAATSTSSTSGSSDCTTVDALTAADENTVVATATSGPDGGFCFSEVPPGDYQIVVSTVDDAELDELVVGGQRGFSTNSPATSEPFFVGFASAALGNPVRASLVFTADEGVAAGDEEETIEQVVDDTEPDEEELPETGVSTWALALSALLALLLGSALLGASQTARTPIRQRVGMRATRH